ncbi:MAG: hypothetical protein JWQ68_358 [Cryobacterium sp.]|nr:hypothetical protein [Cryobacterium sp.]
MGASALLCTLSGCASAQDRAPADEVNTTVAPVAPVIAEDFPDPDVLEVDGKYYAYATNGNSRNVQVAESDDLESWSMLGEDALPQLPPWVIPGKTWAPEVTELSPGQYVMYFTATNFQPSLQCIGVATATSPTGPFVVQGTGMLVCPTEEGGAIDASTFSENGALFLLWKNDGNCCGLDTWLSIAPLTADGLALAAPGQRILKQTLAWEGELVEAPTLVKRASTYHLFYSSNFFGDDSYAVGYASAASLAGPWQKRDDPFLSSGDPQGVFRGPGGQDVVTGPGGEDWLVFHAWDPAYTYRGMFVEPLRFGSSGPEVSVEGT